MHHRLRSPLRVTRPVRVGPAYRAGESRQGASFCRHERRAGPDLRGIRCTGKIPSSTTDHGDCTGRLGPWTARRSSSLHQRGVATPGSSEARVSGSRRFRRHGRMVEWGFDSLRTVSIVWSRVGKAAVGACMDAWGARASRGNRAVDLPEPDGRKFRGASLPGCRTPGGQRGGDRVGNPVTHPAVGACMGGARGGRVARAVLRKDGRPLFGGSSSDASGGAEPIPCSP